MQINNEYNHYRISWWEDILTPSQDERDIILYMTQKKISNVDILHVGIGNNFVVRDLPNCRVTGLTNTISEYQKALSLKFPNYKPILIDKHDPNLEYILEEYDYIIDPNIRSYSPTTEDAIRFFSTSFNHLREDGAFFTHLLGLEYRNSFDLVKELEKLQYTFIINVHPSGVVEIRKAK